MAEWWKREPQPPGWDLGTLKLTKIYEIVLRIIVLELCHVKLAIVFVLAWDSTRYGGRFPAAKRPQLSSHPAEIVLSAWLAYEGCSLARSLYRRDIAFGPD